VLRMVRTLLGPALFREAMNLYFSRHDGQAVTTEDFIQAMADASGRDFSQFLRWYRQAGTPRLDVQGDYSPETNTFSLTVTQSCPATPGQSKKDPFYLPLAIGLLDHQGVDLPLQLKDSEVIDQNTTVLTIKEPKQTFTFINIPEKPVPSLLRNFSAPVKLNYDYSLEDLAHLMCFDSDTVARWEASQCFSLKVLLDLLSGDCHPSSLVLPTLWSEVVSKLLNDEQCDGHLLTRLLTLPTQSYLAQHQMPVNTDAIAKVHTFAKENLAAQLVTQFLEKYQGCVDKKPYQYNTDDMGQRSIKNLCLAYLVATGDESYANLALEQFQTSQNMTDQMGALAALNHFSGEQRTQALGEFYEQWQSQPLVVNKWLALQAGSQLPDTLQRVKELLKHPAFSIDNPNNVYNLIVVFAANLVHFHAADGSGYQFIADQVLAIDPKNPQVSARVVEPLTRWQRFDEGRQHHMREQLQRIQDSEKLSNDVYELVSKSLKSCAAG